MWKMEALPEKVTAGPHFQSLPEPIQGKLCTIEILIANWKKTDSINSP